MDPMALASGFDLGIKDSPIGGDTSASGDIGAFSMGGMSNGGFSFNVAPPKNNMILLAVVGVAVAYFLFKGRK